MKKLREEYIGENIEVKNSKNKQLIGIKGIVLDETKNTFLIKTTDKKQKNILKKDSTFEINNKTIDGNQITKRPEDRIKIKPKK